MICSCCLALLRRGIVHLVEDDHVGELDLLHEEIDQRPLVAVQRLAALAEELGRGIVLQQVGGVDHRHHRVQVGDVGEAFALLRAEIERRCDRERLRNARRFDQQIIEAPAFGERTYLPQEIVAQGAANAAIGHLHQFLISPREVGTTIADQVRIDVHLAHVVHDHRHFQAVPVVQDVVQQSGLSSPEEARQDGDGEFGHGDRTAF